MLPILFFCRFRNGNAKPRLDFNNNICTRRSSKQEIKNCNLNLPKALGIAVNDVGTVVLSAKNFLPIRHVSKFRLWRSQKCSF